MKFLLVLGCLLGATACGAAQPEALADLPRHIALSERLHVSGQPPAEAFPRLRAAGIDVVIDLSPEAETPGMDEESLAQSSGLTYRALPIAGATDLTRENVSRFDQLLKESDGKKVLMHCASGNRVGALMALRARWLEGKSAEEAMAIGKAAGLTALAPAVEERLKKGDEAAAR